jgi:enterochelin esterase-like enzyme
MLRDKRAKMMRLIAALLLGAAIAATASAQGRGGPRGGGQRGGSVEHAVVHGRALEGNSEGDSPDRNVTVYLPPAYAGDPERRFPVIYFLHDYEAHSDDAIGEIKDSADRLAAVQGYSEPIVVTPDASTLHRSSMYSNSAATGDWERFIAEDLVGYIDAHYRTLAKPISRGLAGQSMGGYGALRIGMRRPDVFSSLYLMSACCLAADNSMADAANAPLAVLERNASNLKKYYGIVIEIGTRDAVLAPNRQLHDALALLRIPHRYEEFDGDLAGSLRERIERHLLPFFSKNLAAPANPTSPGVR